MRLLSFSFQFGRTISHRSHPQIPDGRAGVFAWVWRIRLPLAIWQRPVCLPIGDRSMLFLNVLHPQVEQLANVIIIQRVVDDLAVPS